MTEVSRGIGLRAVDVCESNESSSSPVKMCVGKDGVAEPAARR